MKKNNGFTLVELVIVIIIVGILSIVAVPVYRGYTRKSVATEGKALLGVIQMSERAYFAETSTYIAVSNTSFTVLDTAKSLIFKLIGSVLVSANCNVEPINILKF